MPTRVAAVCGLVAPVTYIAALLFGGLAQRDAFSNADDSISDLGADTAGSPWLYDQVGTNLTGILIVVFALGLWRALSPDLLGRLGAGILLFLGITLFLEGFFPLDCQGIDAGCENVSWQSEGHPVGESLHRSLLLPRADRPRVRVPAKSSLAEYLASDACRGAARHRCERRLLGDRRGCSHPRGKRRVAPGLGFIALRLLQKSRERDVVGSSPAQTVSGNAFVE